jgi:hypothetical protein
MLIASTGHSSTHTPQSTHASTATVAFSSFILMASLGQQSTQDSHPVHVSAFTLAGIIKILSKTLLFALILRITHKNNKLP